MSEHTSASTELTSQYAAQVTGDLERNLKEQERVSGEIATLQHQLATLQHDHTVLVNMQQALGITPTAAQPTAAPDQATEPAPRRKGASRTSTKSPAKKAAAAPGRARARKPATGQSQAVTSTPTQTSLIELIRHHLTEHDEPRSSGEIAAALGQAHPERGIKTTVVRTTLENLVAKGQAQRTKQGRSVYYTAPDTPQPTPTTTSEPQPQDAEAAKSEEK
ncbi:BlaI/MecI/CopY family transcriptional regulator [Streptomyces sp. NPDC001663]|uniref:BlaI/MecI/CopY family transcriptional regulator n=1 Tax=Streptomyces sp. NPDC001663 TaxID=3364597 RepID=UPI0036964608